MSPPTEETTLLRKRSRRESELLLPDLQVLDDFLDEDTTPPRKLVAHEFWVLFRGTVPVALAYTLQNTFQTVSILIVGRASPEDLSTAAFSYMFAAATGWLVAMGGTTALDTLASSTFTGSKNKYDLGILLQRAFVILTLLYIPIAVLWAFSEPLFLALGGLGYVYFEIMKKYLQAQGIMRPGSYVLLVTSPISAILNYLFVYVAGWGLFAAPFAVGIGYWLSFLGLVMYCRFVAGNEHWGGWSKRCLSNTGTFTKLALLGLVQMGTEWWSFEIVALAAGRLGELSLAAQSVVMTADQIIATIPLGVGATTSARIGNILGTKNPRGAARSAYTGVGLGVFLGTIILAVLMGTRNVFAKIFNNNTQVVELVSEIMPYVALFQIADGLHGTCGGALRGTGRQHIGAMINIISYYCVGLPIGIYIAFHGMGLVGLWIGQCIALYLVGIIEFVIVAFTNWSRQIEKAFARMDKDVAVASHYAIPVPGQALSV